MEKVAEDELTDAPSTSQGNTRHIPIYRGGYLSSDEEADVHTDTIQAATMLKGVELGENEESVQEVRSHGDVSSESGDEKSLCTLPREAVSKFTTAGPIIDLEQDPDSFLKVPSLQQKSDPCIKSSTRTSTLERITQKVTKHFQEKSFAIPYNLRPRANFQKTSKRIKKSAESVVNKGRFMLKASSKFFKKN